MGPVENFLDSLFELVWWWKDNERYKLDWFVDMSENKIVVQ